MTVEHGSVTIEKTLAAPANVFRAFAEEELKQRRFTPPDTPPDTARDADSHDVRVGGRESGGFEIADGPCAGHHEKAPPHIDIVEGEPIVSGYAMAWNGRVHPASLATITSAETEAGCRLTVTEQGAHFPPSDGLQMRRAGVATQFDALAALFT